MNVFDPIRFATVFPDTPNNFQAFKGLVRRLNRSETLLSCARLNLVVGGSADGIDQQGWLLRRFFTPDQIARIEAYSQANSNMPVTVFFSWSAFRTNAVGLSIWT